MRRLKILIWHIHGSYLNAITRADHDWYLPTRPGHPEGYVGRGWTFDLPPSVREVPAERFAALADALVERCGARIILTGSAGERAVTAAVRGAMRYPALDLAGRTDLGAFAAVVAHLDLLITNDTGSAHLASATSTPSVVLFGPGRPAIWGPLDRDRHRVVEASALAGDGIDPATALQQLPVEPVLALCQEQLDRQLSPIVR